MNSDSLEEPLLDPPDLERGATPHPKGEVTGTLLELPCRKHFQTRSSTSISPR